MSENKAEILSPEEAQRVIETEGYERGTGNLSDFMDPVEDPKPEDPVEDPAPTEDPKPEDPAGDPKPEDPAGDVVPNEDPLEDPSPEDPQELPLDNVVEDPDIDSDISVLTGGMFADNDELIDFATKIQEDPFMKDLLDYYRQEGTVSPYLDAMKVDYDQISDEQLMRLKFNEDFKDSGLTEEELDSAFERKVLAKYSLDDPDSMDELDVKLGQAEMKREANKLRAELKEEQKKFAAPTKPREEPVDKEQQRRDQIKLEARAKQFVSKSMPEEKLSFNIGDNKYDLEVGDQKALTEMITNTDRIIDNALTDGKIDLRKLAFLSNPDEFLAKVQNDAMALAQAEFVDGNLRNKKPARDEGAPPQRELDPKQSDTTRYIEQFRGAQIVKK